MILTGPQISSAVGDGDIVIEPFHSANVNPNSYNFTLGSTLRVYDDDVLDPRTANAFHEIEIPLDGLVLEPGKLYLAHTRERLGGHVYAPTFAARSSIARLGLFINLSASLGDIGFVGQWTLQLYSSQRVRVYSGMAIGQMMWWRTEGAVELYDGKYQGASGPRSSDIHLDMDLKESGWALPRFGAAVDPHESGPKFAALSWWADHVPVPPAFSVPANFTDRSLDASMVRELEDAMTDLRTTVGSYYFEGLARIERIAAGYRLD